MTEARQDTVEKVASLEKYHNDLTRQLLIDADEMEACGAGNEAANMRLLVKDCLELRSALLTRAAINAMSDVREALEGARLFVELVRVHWQNWHPDDEQQIAEAKDCLTRIDAALESLSGRGK